MEISILIVTKNRAAELAFSLDKMQKLIDLSKHEILVFVDGCAATEAIKNDFAWVKWFGATQSVGASPARNALYKNAIGTILIGFDDDAHPISTNFLEKCTALFNNNPNLGIVAFQEVRGVFASDDEALQNADKNLVSYQTNDFVGCGFAIKNEVYKKTNGFPVWMDIYGEESCVAYEVLDAGFDILYDNSIIVNHRVNKTNRLQHGRYYFRFQKQLKNTFFIFLVYYKNPVKPILKLLFHNFKKYALKDFTYFKLFWSAMFQVTIHFYSILKVRKPLKAATFLKIKQLRGLKY